MVKLPARLRLVAAFLSFAAGFVDAIGFVHLGGYFVSFMSGNSTRMAVGASRGSWEALVPALLIVLFVAGVVGGTLVGSGSTRHPGRALLIGVGALLAVAASFAASGLDRTAVFITPIAMGAMNTLFQRNGEVSVGVTYMTGALVKLGQRLAVALRGGPAWDWLPYLVLWLGLVLGAICGSIVYGSVGLAALWLPAIALVLIALLGNVPDWRETVEH